MEKAVIINLDNTLIKTRSGRDIPLHSEDWEINTKILEAIRLYKEKGYFICVVSNQPQIRQGFYSKHRFIEKVNIILKTIEKELKVKSKDPIAYRFCSNDEAYEFMPKPGMIYDLAITEELDLSNSIMIGILPIHELTAERSGIKTYYNVIDFTLDNI